MLALNTNHISEKTRDFLDENGRATESEWRMPEIVVYSKSEYGWFIPMVSSVDEPNADHLPHDLLAIFMFMQKHGYTWLMLDCDVEPIEELPIFNW
jgi:hypothetical protein